MTDEKEEWYNQKMKQDIAMFSFLFYVILIIIFLGIEYLLYILL